MGEGSTRHTMLMLTATFLVAAFAIGADPGVTTVVITATDDSAIRTDQSTREDSPEIEGGNFGDQPLVSSGYVYGVAGDERLVSVGLFQFDLTPVIGEEVLSVHAQLYVAQTVFDEAVRLVDLHMVVEGEWSQDTVTFTSRPGWIPEPVATAAVYGPGLWYSWDITTSVLQLMGSSPVISFATGLRTAVEGTQEEVIFAATEAGTRQPRLVITFAGKDMGIAWWVWTASGAGAAALLAAAFLGGRRYPRRMS